MQSPLVLRVETCLSSGPGHAVWQGTFILPHDRVFVHHYHALDINFIEQGINFHSFCINSVSNLIQLCNIFI